MPSFPDRLKELRIFKCVTQKAMSEFLGITDQAYPKYEYGMREPNHETTIKLADYFGVSVDYLLGRTDELSDNSSSVVAQRLEECRKVKNVTEDDVAENLNIPVTLYWKYESAILEPNIATLNKLAEYFKTSVDYLVGYEPSDSI